MGAGVGGHAHDLPDAEFGGCLASETTELSQREPWEGGLLMQGLQPPRGPLEKLPAARVWRAVPSKLEREVPSASGVLPHP